MMKSLIAKIYGPIQPLLSNMEARIVSEIEQTRLLNARLNVQAVRQMGRLENLADAEFKVFSQWGEDGIIQYLLGRVDIQNKIFVEFGVQDYREANTRFLLENDNWTGLVMECNASHVKKIMQSKLYWQHDLTVKEAFITVENINDLIESGGIKGDIGILSIDIDGNDYWIWDAIKIISPRIVIVEYNSALGSRRAITIPYVENFIREKQHYSMMYFGASLNAFCLLAKHKGYIFAGSNNAGLNAFFVRKDVAQNVKEFTCQEGYICSKFRDSRDLNGHMNFLAGRKRVETMKEMTVYDIELHHDVLLESILEEI